MNSQKKILVIGSGVSGLTTACRLQSAGYDVTIWSKEAPGTFPNTSASAYAMWVPVRIDADPRVERWTNESFAKFEMLAQHADTGVKMREIFVLKTTVEEPWFAKTLKGFRHARAGEISSEYADAHVYDKAPAIDTSVYLPWLEKKFTKGGGKIVQREIRSFDECSGFDIVVNCAGLGARELCNDTTLFPERVQTLTIKSNGFDKVVIDDEGPNKRSCIVPHGDYIKIGGVFTGNNESLTVDDAGTADILARAKKMVPGFKADASDVISVSVAMRPERPLTRVETDKLPDGRLLIHNYGHDGMGYILSYGIAEEVLSYVHAVR
jgi:D-amino-acid oxidase